MCRPCTWQPRRTGCDPFEVVGVLGPKATEKSFVRRMVLALDLDTSPGVVKFSVINLNMSTFDADAYTAVLGQNATQPASLSPDALVTTCVPRCFRLVGFGSDSVG